VLVLLNLCSVDYPLSMRHHLMERAIEVAASLVVYFAGLKQEVGLVAIGVTPASPGLTPGSPPASPRAAGIPSIPVRPGNSHGVRILEGLALFTRR